MGFFDKYDPKERLIHRIDTSNGFNGDYVLAFMKELRELIELKKLQSKFPILNFYCNWCLHPELSGSNTIYRILEEITDFFLSEKDIGSKFIDHVNNLLSMDNLRKQMIELFALENIPDYWISTNYNWYGFRQRLLSNIVRKPIEFPPGVDAEAAKLDRGKKVSRRLKKAVEIYRKIKKIESRGLGAVSLRLNDRVEGEKRGDIYWEVEISKQRIIRSRLLYSDPK